jgi:hypothetical protein
MAFAPDHDQPFARPVGGSMLMPSLMRDWLHLPSRIALLFGLGALSVAGAKAGTAVDAHPRCDTAGVAQQVTKAFGDLLIWQENNRIYVSESGKEAEELRLAETAEAASLRQLLTRQGATAATPYTLRGRIILVGGGGDGFHWDSQRQNDPNQTRAAVTHSTYKHPTGTAKTGQQIGGGQPPASANGNSK